MQWLDFVFVFVFVPELFSDLLKVASLQGLISHLAEIHISIVVARFPLQHTEKHTRFNQVNRLLPVHELILTHSASKERTFWLVLTTFKACLRVQTWL